MMRTNPSGQQQLICESDLLKKEEELRRLNAELEGRTSTIIQEAEEVMKKQEIFSERNPVLKDGFDVSRNSELNLSTDSWLLPAAPATKEENKISVVKSRANRPKVVSKYNSKVSGPTKAVKTACKSINSNESVQDTMKNIEARLDDFDLNEADTFEDVMPLPAREMGTEATLRFLKAKVRVLQEEVERLQEECNRRAEENSNLELKLKSTEEDKGKIQRSTLGLQQQLDRQSRLADVANEKAQQKETECILLKKELESLKRNAKQSHSSHNATEVRLNRALEEVEKLKLALKTAKQEEKDTRENDKMKLEELIAANKRIEMQKAELIHGFKKQMELIDVLKKQKIHLEAARLLQFTEEEFLKLLDWRPENKAE